MHIRSLLFALILPAAACYSKPAPHHATPAEPATPVAQETPTNAPTLAVDETCPMAVPGTTVSVEDNVDGATLVFTTSGDLTALRSRVISLANDHNSEQLKIGALPVGSQRTYANGGATYPNDQNATGAGVASGSGTSVGVGTGSGSAIGESNGTDVSTGIGAGSGVAAGSGSGSSSDVGIGAGSGSDIAEGTGSGSGSSVAEGTGSGSSSSTSTGIGGGSDVSGQLPDQNGSTYASGGAYGQTDTSGANRQGMTGKSMILTHSRAQIEPFDGGVRLVYIADPPDVQALRDEVRLKAEHMKTGRCD